MTNTSRSNYNLVPTRLVTDAAAPDSSALDRPALDRPAPPSKHVSYERIADDVGKKLEDAVCDKLTRTKSLRAARDEAKSVLPTAVSSAAKVEFSNAWKNAFDTFGPKYHQKLRRHMATTIARTTHELAALGATRPSELAALGFATAVKRVLAPLPDCAAQWNDAIDRFRPSSPEDDHPTDPRTDATEESENGSYAYVPYAKPKAASDKAAASSMDESPFACEDTSTSIGRLQSLCARRMVNANPHEAKFDRLRHKQAVEAIKKHLAVMRLHDGEDGLALTRVFTLIDQLYALSQASDVFADRLCANGIPRMMRDALTIKDGGNGQCKADIAKRVEGRILDCFK